ncbi:GNAT family N-acetyltransferase [Bosea psychrotolerans]|uniref:Acetyltransferase (GNAT) family protein n=1 Tax=Bosea psychrotolerans TaxID=1871628 RepID=A0A2S4MA34_9HYPH|nr:GNAT family N-acetyltransferase [Bosea psychrotolerans]POR51469.1 acetyltransferase (GNAT) family protein [Bosea psychrotolerans]
MANALERAEQNDGEVVLLPLSQDHLEGALALSREMSWPYRLADWAVALEFGHGFALIRDGAVLGTAVWWPYGESDAMAGMIIVSRSAQGRGYGARLMDAILAAAGSRVIQLNSTEEGRLLYERRGFAPVGVIQQHQGVFAGLADASLSPLVRGAMPADSKAIADLDFVATGWTRTRMLEGLMGLADIHVLERDGAVRGYCMSRLFGRGHVIGPVIAENVGDARDLILAALVPLSGRFVRIDTSSTSGLGDWFVTLGLEQVGDALTMVRGDPAPLRGPAQRFALANQSFG